MNSPLRILHVEDNPQDAELIQATLEAEGIACQVTVVDTAADFSAAIELGRFDLILTDYTIPSFDGHSALKIALEKCPDVPFLFVSGSLGEEVAIETLKIGATDYVLKDRLSRIVPAVQRALRESQERAERKRAQALLSEEKRLLEMIARGSLFSVVANALCEVVEKLWEGSLCSILLLEPNGNRLWHAAAPSLPKSYTDAIEGLVIGPAAGSCGTAVYCQKPVIVSDIAADSLWADYRDLAQSHGLRACWSTPIFSPDGRVLGTFAVYYGEPRVPTASEQNMIERIADLASIAIERRRAEEERQVHLWFLESMERINRAIQGTNDLEQMMSDVLDAVLAIFKCDRAWLVYPCDPDIGSWKVAMEHTTPEFPGGFALAREMPVTPEIAELFRTVRGSSVPVRFGPESNHPLPAETAARFSIQSVIGMALDPKGDKPYLFELQQCSYPRIWTAQEERLFQVIGRRLEDALTSVLMFRNLGESERKLEEAQHLTHVGYWERDLDTDLITWSAETYRIYGVPMEERALNMSRVLELVHPEDRPMVATIEAMSAALRGGALQGGSRYDVEYRIIRPNGALRIVHNQGDVTWDESGRPRRVFGTVQDITERKRVEQRLLVQYTVTQILAEAATVEEASPKIVRALGETLKWDVGALWRVDRQSGVLRCVELWHKQSVKVPEFETATRDRTFLPGVGLPGKVWLNSEPRYISDLVKEPNVERTPIAMAERLHAAFGFPILLGGEVLGVIEFFSREIRQPDRDLLEMMATIGSQIGQFIERKRAEDALHHVRTELAHVARVSTLGEMSASIAHEINQPLAAIATNASACLRWLHAQQTDEARESATRAIAEVHRTGEIIRRIRALAKKAPPQKDWLDINETVREVIALAQSELQRNYISFELQLADAVQPLVFADRIQLQQVILNLIMNAMQAMSEISDSPRKLLIRTDADGSGEIVVAVRDSGPGIAPENLDRLFTPFYTTKPQGMGMGLAISRSIIEAHGGRLGVTANEDRGATFQFTLPTDAVRAS